MSKTKLGAGTVEREDGTAAPDQAELDQLNGTSTAVAHRPVMDGSLACTGGLGISIRPSYMQIAYGVGKLAAKGFSNSALVLDGEHEIAKLNQPLTVIIAGARKYLKQWMDKDAFAAKARAKEYDSAADAVRAGEIVEWPPRGSGGAKPTVSPALDMTLLIKRPEGCQCPAFVLKLGPDWYAPVRFTVDKALYKDVERMVSNAMLIDAGERGVAPAQGRLDGYFMTLATYIVVDQATSKTYTHLSLGFALGADKGKVPVPGKVKEDLASLTQQLVDAAAQPVAADEESAIPPVAVQM
jgi:hypothetical protein